MVGEEARPRAERRADAVLRRLVDSERAGAGLRAANRQDEGGEDDETWTPSGIDWNATPSFCWSTTHARAHLREQRRILLFLKERR